MSKPNTIIQMSLEFLVMLLFRHGFVGIASEGIYCKYNDLTQTVEVFAHDSEKAERLEGSMLAYERRLTVGAFQEEVECSQYCR